MTTNRDIDALERALQMALAMPEDSPGRHRQIRSMLEDDWHRAASFCAYHLQVETLKLRPWDVPPCFAESDDDTPEAAILRRLIESGLSKWEPNPVEALTAAKKNGAQTVRASVTRIPTMKKH